jgi:proteasome assembly chaperone (PAC2) family protein
VKLANRAKQSKKLVSQLEEKLEANAEAHRVKVEDV